MKHKKNSLWVFLASVKLALFVLFLLAAASILGTVIPQGEGIARLTAFYQQILTKFTDDPDRLAAIFSHITISLGLDDMYHAFWFEALIGLLALNLIVCSIERLPAVWKMVTLDNLQLSPGKIARMPHYRKFQYSADQDSTSASLQKELAGLGWQTESRKKDKDTVIFSQKGPWTRLGVYVVHFSILVIIAGALIGSHFGHTGGVNIPETTETDTIYQFKTGTPIDLGFTVRCNWFTMSRYPSGAPKEYQSELVILENNREMTRKIIEVNDPLTYKGWTFYQSSFEPHKKILITVTNQLNGNEERFLVTPQQPVRWDAENLLFGIQSVLNSDIPMTYQYRLLVSDKGKKQQSMIVADNGTIIFAPDDDSRYTFRVKQFYSTGLQVAKDPGVWLVYLGCLLMLSGLAIAFFMSHQRLWLIVGEKEIQLAGTSNKNKIAFARKFQHISQHLARHLDIEEQ